MAAPAWQYTDGTELVVVSTSGPPWYSLSVADPAIVAYLAAGGTITAAAAPSLAQQASAVIGSGLTITLSGTLTLAATLFPTDQPTIDKLTSVAATIGATGEFPGGASALPLKDASGAWHSLTLSQWKALAGALAAYVAALDLIIDGNPLSASALPTPSVSLTV